jgi:16S rRNA (adenine1518-N6/adenine1519-N6)-dimethyltransferase
MQIKITAKKSLGQNFLKNKSIAELMAKTPNIKEGESVIEIGPGTGMLTDCLLETIKDKKNSGVICIEKDTRLIDLLKEKYSVEISDNKLEILNSDILEFSTKKLTKYHVIANIPYYITGAIIEKFLEESVKPKTITVMIQKEVAKRVVVNSFINEGKKTNEKESILSLAVKYYGDASIIKTVSRGNFYPVPQVDSAILHIDLQKYFEGENKKELQNENFKKVFFSLIKTGLAHKRKILISNLKNKFIHIDFENMFLDLNIGLKTRGEDLLFATWIRLTKYIIEKKYEL